MGKFIAGTLRQGNLKDLHFVSRLSWQPLSSILRAPGAISTREMGSAKSQASPE
jgi:hypothetical protein